jgi:hypothetical protein
VRQKKNSEVKAQPRLHESNKQTNKNEQHTKKDGRQREMSQHERRKKKKNICDENKTKKLSLHERRGKGGNNNEWPRPSGQPIAPFSVTVKKKKKKSRTATRAKTKSTTNTTNACHNTHPPSHKNKANKSWRQTGRMWHGAVFFFSFLIDQIHKNKEY